MKTKVKIEFIADVEQMAGENYFVMVPKVKGVLQQRIWFPGSACTPILPDFGEGDLVEHIPSGARGTMGLWHGDRILSIPEGRLLVRLPFNRNSTLSASWLAAECRIVRKAGEKE